MRLPVSNLPLTFLVCVGVSFLKPPDSEARWPAPTTASQQSSETDLRAEEAKLQKAMKRAPNDPSYPARLGSLLATQDKVEEAVPYFEEALKLNPGDLVTRRNLAASYWQLGKLPEARKNLETILSTQPDDTWSILLLGMVSEDLGDHEAAAKLLGQVLPLVARRPEAIAALARAYYHLDETLQARSTLQTLAGDLAGTEAAFQGGRVAAEFGDYDTAEKMFASIRKTYPDPAMLNYNLALAQYGARRYTDCERTLQDLVASGHGTSDEYVLLGWTYQKMDRLPEMLAAFEKAINMEPSNQTYYLDLGEALVEKKNYGTAMEVAQEMLKRFPYSSRAYSLKGGIELGMEMLTDALKTYGKAIELDPNDSKAVLGLALTQWNAAQDAEAARLFEAGARQFPRDAFFLLKYAVFLLNSPEQSDAGRAARIKALLTKSEELDGSIAETHVQLGNLAIQENKYDEALKELAIAAREDPELSKVHYALARVYRRIGREQDATREEGVFRELKEREEQTPGPNAAIATRHPGPERP